MEIKNNQNIEKEGVGVSPACPETGDIEYTSPDGDKLRENIKTVYRKLRKIDLDTVIKEVLHNIDIAKDFGFPTMRRINIIMICRAAIMSDDSRDLNKIRMLISQTSMTMYHKRDWIYKYRHLKKALEFKLGEEQPK